MDKFVLFRIHLEEHHHDLFHLQEILYALPYFLVEKAKRSLNIWQWNSWRSKKKFRFHPCPNLLQIFKLSWALPAAKLIMKLPGLAKLFANWINLRLKGPKSVSKHICVTLLLTISQGCPAAHCKWSLQHRKVTKLWPFNTTICFHMVVPIWYCMVLAMPIQCSSITLLGTCKVCIDMLSACPL